MDKIIRCITSDGAIMAACVDASDIVLPQRRFTTFHAVPQPHSADFCVQPQLWAICSNRKMRQSTFV